MNHSLYLAGTVGRMAEWLCRGLQILVQRFDSASGLQCRRKGGGIAREALL